jgi:hypothetical protein
MGQPQITAAKVSFFLYSKERARCASLIICLSRREWRRHALRAQPVATFFDLIELVRFHISKHLSQSATMLPQGMVEEDYRRIREIWFPSFIGPLLRM